jgi:hypothetical protein
MRHRANVRGVNGAGILQRLLTNWVFNLKYSSMWPEVNLQQGGHFFVGRTS